MTPRLRLAPSLVALALVGCNTLTGADRLVLEPPDEDLGHHGEGAGGAGSSAVATSSEAATSGSGSTGSGSTSTTTGAGATTSATTTSSSGGGVACDYPQGGFGVNVGDVVAANLSWQGYTEGAAQASTITAQDLFDCDGSKGINALLILSSAEWCGVCQEEAADLPQHLAAWQAKGIRVITLMIEDQYGTPGDVALAASWKSYFGLDQSTVAADPQFSFGGFGSVGLPLQLLVDPRTMEIVDRQEGYSGDYSSLLSLAAQNGG